MRRQLRRGIGAARRGRAHTRFARIGGGVLLAGLLFVPMAAHAMVLRAAAGQPDLIVSSISFAHPSNTPAFSYTVTVQNQGTADADLTNVAVQGYYDPAQGTYPGADPACGATFANGTLLTAGSSTTIVVGCSLAPQASDAWLNVKVDSGDALPESDEGNNVGSVQLPPSADMGVTLSADHSSDSSHPAVAGNTVTYTATVTNHGPGDNNGYTLTLPVPSGTTVDTLPGGCSGTGPVVCASTATLTSGSSDTYNLKLDIGTGFANSAPTAGVTLTQTASLSNLSPPEQGADSNADHASQDVLVVAQADLSAGLAADHSSDSTNPALAGQTVTYTATVSSVGPSDSSYSLVLGLPAGTSFHASGSSSGCSAGGGQVTCSPVAPLAAGGTDTYTVILDVAPGFADTAPNAGVNLHETATVTAAATDSNSGNDTAAADVLVVGQADLGVQLSADHSAGNSNPGVAGTNVVYTAQVTNNGPSDSTAYTLTLDVPAGTTIVSDPNCTGTGPVTCSQPGPLAPTHTDTYTLTLKVSPSFADANPSGGVTLPESASLSGLTPTSEGADTNPDSANADVLVVAQADLAVTATVSPSAPVAGDTPPVDFDVVVTNNGPSDAVGGYVATATLPAGTSFDPANTACSLSGTTITCDRSAISTLVPTAADEFHVLLDVPANYGDASNTDSTPLTLTIGLSSTGTPQTPANTGSDSASPTVNVLSKADLTSTKSAVTPSGTPANTIYANGNSSVNTVTYTLVVSNTGLSDAHHVVLNDPFDAKLTGALFCSGSGCTPSTPYTGSISIGTLAVGTTLTFTVSAQANATLGHSNGPSGFTGAGPYTNANVSTASSSTPAYSAGDSRVSATVNTTIDTVPAPPTIVQPAVAGNTTAAVEWSNAGEGSGGQPITGYTLQACLVTNPSSCTTLSVGPNPNATANGHPVFSYVISGLTNASAYQFGVFATNVVGNSDTAPAGTSTPSAAAFANVIPTTGLLNADTGFSGGASTCSPPNSVTCKNIVGKYTYTDLQNVGAAYNLDAEPNSFVGNTFLRTLTSSSSFELQCMDVASLDPGNASFGKVENSVDGCGPENKVIRVTYPISSTAPHLEYEQLDASITTNTRGAPCLAYSVDSTGTAQCTNPAFAKIYTDPGTGKPTNFCPAEFNPLGNQGWTAQKPCAFVNYVTVAIPGFNICASTQSDGLCVGVLPRPVACTSGPTCGQPVIIGSSVTLGVTQLNKHLAPAWCAKNLAVVPCIFKVLWLNHSTSSGNNDVQIQDYEVGDNFKGAGSG